MLAVASGNGNMMPFPQGQSADPRIEDSQSLSEDYADAVSYKHGQLNPDKHQQTPEDKAAAYSLTNATLRRNNVDRVAVPRYTWSVYCCPHFDPNLPFEIRYMFPAFAAYGLNEAVANFVVELQVERLEALIK
ncbi:endonuclease domain-containing 1 protein-like [Arapaima gigas]